MEKIRKSNILKVVCYILIPILVAIFVLSIFHMAFLSESEGIGNEEQYNQTEMFAEDYLYFIVDKISDCTNYSENYNTQNFIEIQDQLGNSYYYSNNKNYSNGINAYIDYIIINKKTNEMYTNIKSNNYQQEIEKMKNSESIYWNLIDGKIETDMKYINSENIKYKSNYIRLLNEVQPDENYSINNYNIYTSYNENKTNQFTNFAINREVYQFMIQNRTLPIYIFVVSLIVLVMITIYLFWAIGYKNGEDGISLNVIDNIPYEILTIICLTIASIFLTVLMNVADVINYMILIISTICYLICYVVCAIMGVTTIKRIKAKKFWKSFLAYKIIKWFVDRIKKFRRVISNKVEDRKKVFWYYWGFIIISIILASMFSTGIGILLLIAFWVWTFYKIREYQNQQQKIKDTLQDIYEGKTDIQVDEKQLKGILKEMAIYINDIAGGFSNAIEESLKSERLKTELITNVSHDIKTPLTSIINYVDLLKKEQIENDKIKEYIEILDKKSQRLKKLTEDLIEASKVSSGNVKLNIEEINIKELLNQTIGEFKDRFTKKNLQIETTMPESEIKIKADSRYMYRIIENLFSNITKYALDNSRVYIDIEEQKKEIKISIKNISRDKLNINSDELMQRFVRGDKSRYTEGSGLGLSIAQSLTELQNGKFGIKIDGDLFKVEMIWNYK